MGGINVQVILIAEYPALSKIFGIKSAKLVSLLPVIPTVCFNNKGDIKGRSF